MSENRKSSEVQKAAAAVIASVAELPHLLTRGAGDVPFEGGGESPVPWLTSAPAR